MKLNYHGISYEYNPPVIATVDPILGSSHIAQKSRWLFLNRAKLAQRRKDTMLIRSAQSLG